LAFEILIIIDIETTVNFVSWWIKHKSVIWRPNKIHMIQCRTSADLEWNQNHDAGIVVLTSQMLLV
jgi:hypothetical protein